MRLTFVALDPEWICTKIVISTYYFGGFLDFTYLWVQSSLTRPYRLPYR
jgi:hypothetical protein